ncbi:MAG TPA: flagellar motor switch protein FliN [Rhodocyclaceae bacterium]|nr:flagellar motor switch protein FliN [Rhodocyclaceae bacterium]
MADVAEQQEATTDDDWAAAMAEQHEIDATPAQPNFQDFGDAANRPGDMQDFDMILDIPVQLTVQLGRARIAIRELLKLSHGSVVELETLAGEPMDVLINGTLIAQGEVVVVNDKFGIRLTDIVTPSERMRKVKH